MGQVKGGHHRLSHEARRKLGSSASVCPSLCSAPLGNVQVSVLPPFSAQKHFWGAQRRVRITPGAEADPEDIAEE